MPDPVTHALASRGVSLWLDDLSRDRFVTGGLQTLVDRFDVTGVTTNPTIFSAALAKSSAYEAAISRLAATGTAAPEAALQLMVADVVAAADVLEPVHTATRGADGWVSIEVGPDVAHDEAGTIAEARDLHARADRPNVFVKIPATSAGLRAIAAAVAEGISVNVTLIFGLARYVEVIDAYLTGLERAAAAGLDLRRIRSVASFFVSRVDVEVGRRLDGADSIDAAEVSGAVGVANCRLALDVFDERFGSERAMRLRQQGAHPQPLLWASTGVKDPRMRDTRYVDALATAGCIITMPEATLRAVADHGSPGDLRDISPAAARAVLGRLDELGISYGEVVDTLERQGVDRFVRSGRDLLRTVQTALSDARGAA
jgi:transaldolase